MLHCLKSFHCLSCNNIFSNRVSNCYKDAFRENSLSNYPLIMKCGHTICETCAQNYITRQKKIVCVKCQHCTEFDEGVASVSKLLPDLHVLGILSANQKQMFPSMKKQIVSASSFIGKPNDVKEKKKMVCEKCTQREAMWNCETCEEKFCNTCFEHMHNRRRRTMMKHEKKLIEQTVYESMIKNVCEEHDNRDIEFYCEDDDELVCSHCCVTGKHKGHSVMTLFQKNDSCKGELKSAIDKALCVKVKIKHTAKKLMEVIPSERKDYSHIIKEIHENFHNLHAVLQLREAQLISEVEALANSQVFSLENMHQELLQHLKDLENQLCDANKAIKNLKLSVSFTSLIEKLKYYNEIPLHLAMTDEDPFDSGIEFNHNIDLLPILKNYGSVTGNISQKYCLKQAADVSDDYISEDPEDSSSVADTESVISKCEALSEDSLLSLTDQSCDISLCSEMPDKHSIYQPERVVVSHIRDPSKFWVQRCSEKKRLKAMSDVMNKWCNSSEAKKHIPKMIAKDLYLVKYSADKKWYRGRVKKIITENNSTDNSTIHINDNSLENLVEGNKDKQIFIDEIDSSSDLEIIVSSKDLKVEVQYIDFGNSEIVPVSNLRNIQKRFLNLPGAAKECCLYDIYSLEKNKWSDEAIKIFAKFVGNKEVIMLVVEERFGIYYIDLTHSAALEIADDVPVSVRDALVFLEHGYFIESKSTGNASSKKNVRTYLPADKLHYNVEMNVILSHVESPSSFYVQQILTASKLSSLINEMNSVYKTLNSLHRIYVPYVGMICTAQYSVDKKWYRAEVLALTGGAMVEVEYVDFGNKEVLHNKYLRKLFDCFSKLNKQAIKCSLADVVPKGQKEWNTEAKDWLMKIAFRKQFLLKSKGFSPEENKAIVALYERQKDVDVCINALMVEEAMASSSGESSLRARIEKRVEPEPMLSSKSDEQSKQAFSEQNESNLWLLEIEKKNIHTSSKPPKVYKNNLIPICISHIESPGLFWIRLVPPDEHTKTKLNKLMENIQFAYQNAVSCVDCPKVGKVYAVFNEEDGKWYRGIICEAKETTAKVHFLDYGYVQEVSVRNLRILYDDFQTEMAFALKCHLVDIKPAGDSKAWSKIACEYFQEITSSQDVLFLMKKGEVVDKSLPSDVLYTHVRRGGALEADIMEHVSVIDKLVEKGFALRPRRNLSVEVFQDPQNISEVVSDKLVLSKISVSDVEKKVIRKEARPEIQWKPPEKPEMKEFEAMITYVEEGGIIHLYDIKRGSANIDLIQKTLQHQCLKFKHEKLKIPPAIGEACIAKFILDDCWYRAEVVSHTPDKVKVCFVDYGNIENVKLEDVHKNVILTEIPRQAIECKLYNIKPKNPDETWTADILNFLHSAIVEQQCFVEIHKDPELGKPLEVSLKLSNGIDIAHTLVAMGEAEEICDYKWPCGKSTPPITINERAFRKASPLKEGEPFKICVTQMLVPNLIFLQQLQVSEPLSGYDKARNIEYDGFLSMMKELNSNADTFPVVEAPCFGSPYCAKFTYDDRWYRCEVTEMHDNVITVLYVDYGNTEEVTVERLRKLGDPFVDFPVQSHLCKLRNIEYIEGDWSSGAISAMYECLFNSNSDIYARIVKCGKVYEIELLTRPEGKANWNLIYQDLVDKKIVGLQE